jgi:TetR/AcrR family transcriptional regulator
VGDGLPPTNERIIDAALTSFGTRGFEGTSLDDIAATLGIRKQTILYWFPSKEALLNAVIDRSAAELAATLERTLDRAATGWPRVEAIVNSVFRVAARRPELLGLVREVSRLGPPASARMLDALQPLMGRATGFLEAEMRAGRMRPQDPRVVLLAAYSAVLGLSTEVDVLRALGFDPTARDLVRRRRQLLDFLRSALDVPALDVAGPAKPQKAQRLRAGGV